MMESLPKVIDFMDTEVPAVGPKLTMTAAVDFLLSKRVTGAPVVDGEGMLLGILTERDCLKLLAEGSQGGLPQHAKVSEYMSTDVVTLPVGADIFYAAGIFLSHTFRRLPVVEGGRVVGAITRYDILRAIQALRSWSPGA